jgi:RNA polymerase sigma-70 factor (ECF subfamily)
MQVIDYQLLSRLFDEHSAALVIYAQQWCSQPEDIVQEAFIQLMRQRPAPSNTVGWLYRAVRNGAVSSSRSAARRARNEALAASRRSSWFVPSDKANLHESNLIAALDALPMDDREVIVLRVWGRRSFDEIAEIIDKSTSTAHRRYETALQRLRQKCLCLSNATQK